MIFLLSFLSFISRVVFLYRFRQLAPLIMVIFITFPAYAAVNIPLTVNLSETVNVTGTPRIAVDVGGTTRYATYTSGTGSNALTFTLSPQTGDVDLDGVTVSSPIDLNGGTITDTKGNNAALTFTPPGTTNVKVNYPSLGMDFVYDADGRYTLNGTPYNDLSSFLTAAGGSFTRASIGTYFDSTGTLQTAASGTPRFDYDPVTHAAKGILIEESRTNLLTKSSEFDASSAWHAFWISVTPDTLIAPDGTSTADLVIENTTNNEHYVENYASTTSNGTYTATIYVKAYNTGSFVMTVIHVGLAPTTSDASFTIAGGLISPNTRSGIVTSSSAIHVGNGWYRCSATYTLSGTVTSHRFRIYTKSHSVYTGDGTSGIYMWGAQVEQGSFPTSYIPTTTATVTRAAENLVLPVGSWFNNSSGTLFGEAAAYNSVAVASVGSSPTFASINTSTASNIARLGRYISAPSTGLFQSSVAPVTFTNLGLWPNNSTQKVAGSYSELGFSSLLGTNTLNTAGAAALPGTITEMRIGQYALSGYWSSTISKVKYYPTRITNTQLQLLTQ